MLSTDKITKNAGKYFKTAETYGFMSEELMEFLGVEIVKAPASDQTSKYNAFEGGLIDHLLKVAKYAININTSLPENIQVKKEALLKVCLLHQIGKAKLYIDNDSQWHKDNLGQMYKFNENLIAMKIGERSVYYATQHGISFTETEYQAIMNFDKDLTDKQAMWFSEPMSIILRTANDLAMLDDKNTKTD
mgnify:FL=1|tara:strand:- start:1268 stop:1837 length:570 start_codon:yes stop_codon:yes gene_type:complete